MRQLTDQTFQAALKSRTPVLVDFWAPWCGPCRQLESVLTEVEALYGAALDVYGVNVDVNPQVTLVHGVIGVPVLALFVGGRLVKQLVGAKPKRVIVNMLSEQIGEVHQGQARLKERVQ